MTVRFWRPISESSADQWGLVACVASSQYLWAIAVGPGRPIITKEEWEEHILPEMLHMTVKLASGIELATLGGGGGDGSKQGQEFFGKFEAPPEPSEPLTVTMSHTHMKRDPQLKNWSVLFETQVFPA